MDEDEIQVLVIEDDEEDYQITSDFLSAKYEGRQFSLKRACSLEAGIKTLPERPDAILLDLNLPDSSGWDTFQAIQRVAPQAPIILMAVMSDEAFWIKALQQGAQDYLVKGRFDGPLLSRAIRYAIERKKTDEQLKHYANQLKMRNTQMEEDLGMARQFQRSLIPTRFTRFPLEVSEHASAIHFTHVYLPCASVGGDFFQFITMSENQAGIFIADVMGHGTRAALITAVLSGLLEKVRSLADQPGLFMSELNQALRNILGGYDQLIFASAVYLLIDLAKAEIHYVSAGHAHPLRMVPASGKVGTLRPDEWQQDPALGIIPEHDFSVVQTRVNVGDRLLFFTDGICEPQGSEGVPYGDECLVPAITKRVGEPMQRLLEGLIGDVQAYAGVDVFEDDICLVGAEVTRVEGA